MDDRTEQLEKAVASIRASVARLEDRIAALELRELANPLTGNGELELIEGAAPDVPTGSQMAAVLGTPTLVGRSLLVLAGAFLLRVLTERGSFAPGMGVAMGLTYAMIWIFFAALAARTGARASAAFHAVSSAVIAGPLLFEAVASFGVLSPSAAVIVLAGATAAGLLVSIRWRLRSAAWVFTLSCLITAAAVATVRSPGEAATAVVVALGIATLWYAGELRWSGLKWLTAVAADLAVLRLTTIATVTFELGPEIGPVHPVVVAELQALLVFGFVGTFVFRSLRGKSPVGAFTFVQTAAVWLVGWVGAIRLAGANGWSTDGLVFTALIAGAAAYAGAFGVVDRRQGRNAAFVYLSSLGLGLVLAGLHDVAAEFAAVMWAGLAVGVAVVGSRWNRVTLLVHAAVLVLAAWIAAGIAPAVAVGLVKGVEIGTTPGIAIMLVVVLTLVTTVVVSAGRRRRPGGWIQQLPLAVLLLLSVLAVAAATAATAARFLPPVAAAATPTLALSVVTVGLAGMAKRWGLVEAGWLVFPFLVVTGLRMIARDFLSGQTHVLVIALAAYGIALIVSTKMVKPSLGTAGHGPANDGRGGDGQPGSDPEWTA
jgi:hypothetical protein